ncbi:MFS transporter, ACS family, solute carrier family 17 (sodium-dependent inorganic phosphate [Mytilus galloprovincialis]|uniref:Sialin n=1 Tax=Mytilus galloprovincialis TaxID=29158 RepID=A0A8B6H2Z5_MYTGA|nr:MFS transporter, ACS family, solute carrier family 17 (sodium-dependent inorganic phosphate [Mytilus galloprovincialis]
MLNISMEKQVEKKDDDGKDVPSCCSQRWILAYTGFFGFVFVYALRVNFSVAIVCMVKSLNSSSSNNISDINDTSSTCSGKAAERAVFNQHAEFEWEKQIQSTLLASFFYGYIVTQIPGGYLSDRFGGRRVFGTAMAVACICTLVMPACARVSVVLVYVLRVLLGLATGVSFPSMQSMWGRWAPPLERSRLVTVSYLGTMFGSVGTFASSGYLCEYGFDNGWGSIFYITGGLACIWVVVWFILVRDTPSDHPWISDAERDYINNSIEYDNTKRNMNIPWVEIAKSPAVMACITAHVCNNWINYTLLTSLPAFMKAVLKFNIKSNGLLSAVPYLCQAVSGFGVGQMADLIRSKQLLSTTGTRRLWNTIAFIGAGAFLIGTGFVSCDQRNIAVAFLSIAVMFTGFSRAGYVVNHVDFGPKYAGVLYGITNTFATVPGMVAPIVAGALTPNDTQEEWRNVFYVCAAFCVVGIVVFGLFSSGEIQEWAKDREEIIVEKPAIDTDTNTIMMK